MWHILWMAALEEPLGPQTLVAVPLFIFSIFCKLKFCVISPSTSHFVVLLSVASCHLCMIRGWRSNRPDALKAPQLAFQKNFPVNAPNAPLLLILLVPIDAFPGSTSSLAFHIATKALSVFDTVRGPMARPGQLVDTQRIFQSLPRNPVISRASLGIIETNRK